MDRWFFLCLRLPTLGHRGPRLGIACVPPQLAEVWPTPSLVSLPRQVLAFMRNSVILTGVEGVGVREGCGIFKQEVQQITSLFCLKWWLTACYDVITNKILTGCYQAQQYRRCNLTTRLHSHNLPLYLEFQLRNYSLTLDYHSLFCA